jgi:membrane protease YdiL (CAAX protease family)
MNEALPAEPTPPIPPAVPPRPVLAAGWRVLLYVAVWFGVWVAAQTAGAVLFLVVELLRTHSMEAAQRGMGVGAGPHTLPALGFLGTVQYAAFAGTLGITALFVHFVDRRPLASLGFQRVPGWWAQWPLGFLIEGAHFGALFGVGCLAGWYRVTGFASPVQTVVILVVAILLALPAAAVEEITMRGYVLQALESRWGTVAAVVSNAALFALLHIFNPDGRDPMALAGLFLAGVYLSVAYVATRQLWLPIAMHTAWNVFEGPVFGLPVSGMDMPQSVLHVTSHGPAWGTGGGFGPEAGLPVLFTTAVWIVFVGLLGRRLRRQDAPEPPPLPAG